jgi:photosystem II stability/assembly factor-like uncharacterized protein
VVDPHSVETVFVGSGSQVFKSSDGGENWLSVFSLPDFVVGSIGVAPTSPSAIFVGVAPSGPTPAVPALPGEVFRSTDGGTNWTNLTDPFRGLPGVFVDAFAFEVLTPTVYVGTWGIGVFRSTDMGDTWAPMTSGLTDPFVSALAFDSSAQNRSLYAGTAPDGALAGGPVFKAETTLGPPSEPPNRFTHAVPFRGPR